MKNFLKFGVLALMGALVTFGMSSCHNDEPDVVVPPTVAEVHTISGSVASIDGTAIAGATVKCEGALDKTVTTDSKGYFIFPDVPVGDFTLTASANDKISEQTNVTVIDDGKGYNVVWNVMLASIQSSTNISVSTTDGGEGKVTTEALKNNVKAEVPVTVDVNPGALSKNATIWVRPVYTDKAGGSRATENCLLVGAEVGCSDAGVVIEKPFDITFDVDDIAAAEVTTMKMVNGTWVEIPKRVQGGDVIVSADSFTVYALFAKVNIETSTTRKALTFARNEWNNINGGSEMHVDQAQFEYKVGMEASMDGTNVFTALLIETLARKFGANSFTTTGYYPLNVTLPIGTFLTVSGTQDINSVKATVGRYSATGTQYGDVVVTVTTGGRDHTGGSGGSSTI